MGVKLARGYGVSHAKPEFEDVAALAREGMGREELEELQDLLDQLSGGRST